MPSQVRLNFARIKGREIFVDLFENHLTRLLAQTLAQHPEKLRLHGKSQSLIPLMKPSLFDIVGGGHCEFFAILLAQRRSSRDDIDEVFDFRNSNLSPGVSKIRARLPSATTTQVVTAMVRLSA
jgi:hypothetical protein